jgi:hypothetical protein
LRSVRPVRQLLGHLIRTARDVATDSGPELYDLTDVKFAGWQLPHL